MRIYKTINLVNNKIYVGQEQGTKDNYLGSGKELKYAIKKYGRPNFSKEILEDNINNIVDLNNRERYWIEYLDAQNPVVGYNRSGGGQGGNFLSLEQHDEKGKKISCAKRGKALSADHIERIKETVYSDRVKKKLNVDNPFYGKKHTGDLSRFGVCRIGVTPGNAMKIKDDRGNVYNSCIEAAQQFPNPDCARRAISDVCKGNRLHYRNIIFNFIKEKE